MAANCPSRLIRAYAMANGSYDHTHTGDLDYACDYADPLRLRPSASALVPARAYAALPLPLLLPTIHSAATRPLTPMSTRGHRLPRQSRAPNLPLRSHRRTPYAHPLQPALQTRSRASSTSYGHSPVRGWPSRDPIGERGGENLYAFVGNDGVDGADILGDVPTTYEPPDASKTPVVWKLFSDAYGMVDKRNPAHTEYVEGLEVQCACRCYDSKSLRQEVFCQVSTAFTIDLNLAFDNGPTGIGINGKLNVGRKRLPISWGQVVGHEQQHVLSRIAQVKEVVKLENSSGREDGEGYRGCALQIEPKASQIKKAILEKWWAGPVLPKKSRNHKGYPGEASDANSTEESPMDEVGYGQLQNSIDIPEKPEFNR